MFSFDMRPVFNSLTKDLGFSYSTRVYLSKRFDHEGLPFLTRTLPSLSKHILRCIEVGTWQPFMFEGCSSFRISGSERFTAFIADELKIIFAFDRNDQTTAAYHLWRVRQLCEYCYKLALPFTDAQLDAAESGFIACEQEMSASNYFDADFSEEVRKVAETFLPNTKALGFAQCLNAAHNGPGTFSGMMDTTSVQYSKDVLDGTFPIGRSFTSGSYRSRKSRLATGSRFKLRPVAPRTCSEVLFVPKDSRGPRTIVREPYHFLRAQMGFHSCFKRALEKDSFGRIQFTSQEIFRDISRQASKTKVFATLDLKEASDRVSLRLCRTVFRHFPSFVNTEKWFRTKRAKLPSGRVILLSKLSGMGSGFTFPVMAAVIYCTAIASLPKSWRRGAAKEIYVYGDDLIVPSRYFSRVTAALNKVGLTVNTSKSFVNSNFRESCGGDFYFGETVTPVRLKLNFLANLTAQKTTLLTNARRDVDSIILKIERHCRVLVENGLIETASRFYTVLERHLGYPLPTVSGSSPILGRYSLLRGGGDRYPTDRYGNYNTIVGLVPMPVLTRTSPEGLDRSFSGHLNSISVEDGSCKTPSPLMLDAARYRVRLQQKTVSVFSTHI
jgi:hypothetical protein